METPSSSPLRSSLRESLRPSFRLSLRGPAEPDARQRPLQRRLRAWRFADKLLKAHGWSQARGGKHQVKMTKPGNRPITLPQHKGRDYPPGLARAILKQAGLR